MKHSGVLAVVGLVVSAVALLLAPMALPESYSWVDHTTSEAGAQGVGGAWVARTGFVIFGLSVLWIAAICAKRWGRTATVAHAVFGVSLVAVAVFSHRSWLPDAAYDQTEDVLHSLAATLMGFAFALGVLVLALKRNREDQPWRVLDITALSASAVLPLGMTLFATIDGLLQRLMFLVAYLWYGREALASHDAEYVQA